MIVYSIHAFCLTPEALRGGGGGGGEGMVGVKVPPPPSSFLALNFAALPIVKSFGTTVLCLLTHRLMLIR